VTTDACPAGMGAPIGQGKKWQTCHPTTFMSEKFTNTQHRYFAYKLEALMMTVREQRLQMIPERNWRLSKEGPWPQQLKGSAVPSFIDPLGTFTACILYFALLPHPNLDYCFCHIRPWPSPSTTSGPSGLPPLLRH
ncbi:uncharacterized protein EI90DRAFT_2914389, partial [Cantharellus anzutake]|uniref:uncharacterized protein n=1 Tax=Cantharellus anzutake TaxID=1750568 RepID=UPI0019034D83